MKWPGNEKSANKIQHKIQRLFYQKKMELEQRNIERKRVKNECEESVRQKMKLRFKVHRNQATETRDEILRQANSKYNNEAHEKRKGR